QPPDARILRRTGAGGKAGRRGERADTRPKRSSQAPCPGAHETNDCAPGRAMAAARARPASGSADADRAPRTCGGPARHRRLSAPSNGRGGPRRSIVKARRPPLARHTRTGLFRFPASLPEPGLEYLSRLGGSLVKEPQRPILDPSEFVDRHPPELRRIVLLFDEIEGNCVKKIPGVVLGDPAPQPGD